jgi:hypothetical protein
MGMKISTFPFAHSKILVDMRKSNVCISWFNLCYELQAALTEHWLHFLILFLPRKIVHDASK